MDLAEFFQRYTDDVYTARDAEAARRFIADPCLRHEAGELITMALDDNVARIQGYFDRIPTLAFTNKVLAHDGEYVTTCFDMDMGGGQVMSGIEVLRVVDGKIVETWNAPPAAGAWG